MHFSWKILVIAELVNLFCVGLMFWAQWIDKGLPTRGSTITGTHQKFLYMQDFYHCTWGNLIGVPLIICAFGHLMANGFLNWWQWMLICLLAILSAIRYLQSGLSENHKPDQGYPCTGEISLYGLYYLLYFGVCIAMSTTVICYAFVKSFQVTVHYLAAFGLIQYVVCYTADIMTGHFDLLETEQKKKPERASQKGMCYEE